jgi:hypothetical protein
MRLRTAADSGSSSSTPEAATDGSLHSGSQESPRYPGDPRQSPPGHPDIPTEIEAAATAHGYLSRPEPATSAGGDEARGRRAEAVSLPGSRLKAGANPTTFEFTFTTTAFFRLLRVFSVIHRRKYFYAVTPLGYSFCCKF